MINSLRLYTGTGFDPYYNLAVEKRLLDTLMPGECILYLWQNQNTVVIGRSQNPWAECRTTLLEEEGGKLARRLSGGGAVFHDLGNLNFTFLANTEDYNVDRQLQVIQQACLLAGIQTQRSGRNDVLADGRKFSGNAFYHAGGHSYHHGTLLIDVDMEKLQRYLSPPKAKLEAKGIASVRSRVVNLNTLSPALTIERMKALMQQAFAEVYGLPVSSIELTPEDLAAVEEVAKTNQSWEFLFGKPLPFSFSCDDRFDWGHIQLQIAANGGLITGVKVYSDAMDWQLAPLLEEALIGRAFQLRALQQAIRSTGMAEAEDLCQMLERQAL